MEKQHQAVPAKGPKPQTSDTQLTGKTAHKAFAAARHTFLAELMFWIATRPKRSLIEDELGATLDAIQEIVA